jgi:hypothetical protein
MRPFIQSFRVKEVWEVKFAISAVRAFEALLTDARGKLSFLYIILSFLLFILREP